MLKPQEKIQPHDRFERVRFEDINVGDWLVIGYGDKPEWHEVYQVCRKTVNTFHLCYVSGGPVKESSGYSPSIEDKWLRRIPYRDYKVDQEPLDDEETL